MAPLSMEFSRQEYWSGLSFPSPGNFPSPGIEPWFPALQEKGHQGNDLIVPSIEKLLNLNYYSLMLTT